MRKLSNLVNLTFISLSFLLIGGANGEYFEGLGRIPEDAAFDPKKSKEVSDRLFKLHQQSDLHTKISSIASNHAEDCLRGFAPPEACDADLQILKHDLESHLKSKEYMFTLFSIYVVYHQLMTMNLDARDELAARNVIKYYCGHFENEALNNKKNTIDDNIGETLMHFAEWDPSLTRKVCVVTLGELSGYLRTGRADEDFISFFKSIRKNDLSAAERMLESERESAIEDETKAIYAEYVRRGAA